MYTVTADTGRDFRIARFQQPAMNAGLVLLLLVHPQSRIELFHEARVVVTLATERGNVHRSRAAQITFGGILRGVFVVLGRIAAVAIVTGQPAREMDVVLDRARRIAEFSFQLNVAFNAGAFLLSRDRTCGKQNYAGAE